MAIVDDLFVFFEGIKEFATPTATHFVWEHTGVGLQGGEENILELETSWSKWHLYG